MGIGFDCGTGNLVCSKRTEDTSIEFTREFNCFLKMPLDNDLVYNMMEKSGVPLIRRDDAGLAYVLGEAAQRFAHTLTGVELLRPMKDGCVNPSEVDAFEIMNIMMHNILGDVPKDREILMYSVPANAINQETDADYHQKILEAIFKAYRSEKGFTVDARPMNEAMAIVYAEMADKMYTGIGVSCGSGMVNVAFSLYGKEIFSFALVNSGDWIDKQASKASGKDQNFINKAKLKIDLNKEPKDIVERAIMTQYQLMIEKTVAGIKKGLEENAGKIALDGPVRVVVAGGTSSPPGFDKMFANLMKTANLPIEIGGVIRPNDPLYTVAKGLLVAAENSK